MKIGIYGGSFNPPHLGHLHAAAEAATSLGLDELLLIPAGIPPHKAFSEDARGAEHRLAMTEIMADVIAFQTGVNTGVSRMEIDRTGKSYTVDTVRAMHATHPEDELWLLMGTDMFLSFQDWFKPGEIAACAGICAFGRNESDTEELFRRQREALSGRFPGIRLALVQLPEIVEVSSTELRAALPEGGGAALLDAGVLGYIYREHLYGTTLDLRHLPDEALRKVSMSYLRAKRRAHVLGTESEAVRLAQRFGADVEKARVAALLHDSTKKLNRAEHLALAARYGVDPATLESYETKLLHAKTGAILARSVFGVDDEIYEAISWHTTGRANMSLLEKVIYLADYIEPNRTFDGVDTLRAAVYEDIDKGLAMGLSLSVKDLERRGVPVHEDTRAAYEYISKR